MLGYFTDDAILTFEGIPVGPFHGKAVIAAAYATQPPDDEITVLTVREDGDTLTATYAWHRPPGTPAGEMSIAVHNGKITGLLGNCTGPGRWGRLAV